VSAARNAPAPTAFVALILAPVENMTICRINTVVVARTDCMRSYICECGTQTEQFDGS
jgi:hypothetical protein